MIIFNNLHVPTFSVFKATHNVCVCVKTRIMLGFFIMWNSDYLFGLQTGLIFSLKSSYSFKKMKIVCLNTHPPKVISVFSINFRFLVLPALDKSVVLYSMIYSLLKQDICNHLIGQSLWLLLICRYALIVVYEWKG